MSSIINPDKLRHLGPLADLGALLREWSSHRARTGLKDATMPTTSEPDEPARLRGKPHKQTPSSRSW